MIITIIVATIDNSQSTLKCFKVITEAGLVLRSNYKNTHTQKKAEEPHTPFDHNGKLLKFVISESQYSVKIYIIIHYAYRNAIHVMNYDPRNMLMLYNREAA